MINGIDKSENSFFYDVKVIIKQVRKFAYNSVNSAMVRAYWLIGKRIVLEQQKGEKRAEYGKYVIENLSKELAREFGKGFSVRSIREYRQFYLKFSNESIRRTVFAESGNEQSDSIIDSLNAQFKDEVALNDNQIWRTVFAQLSWSHIRLIMRLENNDAIEYYIKETVENNWSVRTLDRNISTQYYERLLLSQTKEIVKKEMEERTNDFQKDKFEFIKNPAVLEFLNLPNNVGYTESQIEKAIIDNLQKFLLELGKEYAFVDRQKLIRTEARDYYIDLVFYNYILKCFVLIDLKAERITHQDVGQMDMYVRMYNIKEKQKEDNPTLGIVLCSETDKDIARYSILKGNEQLFATKYKLYLPTEEELKAEIERQKINLKLQLEK